MKIFAPICFALLTLSASAMDWCVDNSLSPAGLHNGNGWTTAWTNLSNVTGTSDGDTVYISGGPSGSCQYYQVATSWTPPGGTHTAITYKIGQDTSHNGTVIFTSSCNGGYGVCGSNPWIGQSGYNLNNVTLSGDAGDGNRHFAVSNFNCIAICYNTVTNLRLSYINFGLITNTLGNYYTMNFAGLNGFEFDHNYCALYDTNGTAYMSCGFLGTGFDQNLIHDNFILIPNIPFTNPDGGNGADGIKGGGSGLSIYNNTIISYASTAYTGAEHADGVQITSGSFIKIYNNYLFNFPNSAIVYDPTGGGAAQVIHDVWLYNNVSDTPWFGLMVQADNGGNIIWSNIVVANNTVRTPGTQNGIAIGSGGTASVWTNCFAANNIVLNGGVALQQNSIPLIDNVSLLDATAGTNFFSFIAGSTNSNYHLVAGATSLIYRGTNLASYFTTDKDGVSQGALWDIGAYAYSVRSGTNAPAGTNTVLIIGGNNATITVGGNNAIITTIITTQ